MASSIRIKIPTTWSNTLNLIPWGIPLNNVILIQSNIQIHAYLPIFTPVPSLLITAATCLLSTYIPMYCSRLLPAFFIGIIISKEELFKRRPQRALIIYYKNSCNRFFFCLQALSKLSNGLACDNDIFFFQKRRKKIQHSRHT